MDANALCEIAQAHARLSTMVSASIPASRCAHSARPAGSEGGVVIMKRVFTVMLIATAWVVGSTPSFARGGVVHLLARGGVGHGLGGGFVRNVTTLLGASPPSPTFEDRIPRRSWHLSRHPS